MKYMLMMNAPRGNGGWGVQDWKPEDFRAMVEFMTRFRQQLDAAGELVGAEGLDEPGNARLVRAGDDGAPLVTDGPFAETKEFLAGYWIVEVPDEARAHAIAAQASACPGPGGKPLNMPIEVRQVMAGPPQN